MKSFIIYCPHLNRDIRNLLNAVPFPQIWTGEKTERGEDGCLQCHQAIVAQARERRLSGVFVMEDDCFFTKHFFYEQWLSDCRWAENNGFDVLVGGCTRTYDEKLVWDGIVEVEAFHSAHCIAYFPSSYDKIPLTVQPYDVSVGRQAGCRVALTLPFIAVQAPSFSGILRQNVDYVPLYESHERALARHLGIDVLV